MKKHNPGCNCCTPTACNSSVWVKGCYALPVGSGITVNLQINSSTIFTANTNSNGYAVFNSANGAYDIQVVDSRSNSRWNTHVFSNASLTCNSSYITTLFDSANGYTCTKLCGDPLKNTLYATDPNGTWTLTQANGVWNGCAYKTSMSSVVTALAPGICTPTVGNGTVNYLIVLDGVANTLGNVWGRYLAPSPRTTATSTCANGAMNYNAGIPVTCIGAVGNIDGGVFNAVASACPPSFSLSDTMPTLGSDLSAVNPGAGSITITE